MNNQVKSALSDEHDTAGPWYPLRKGWESGRTFNQEAGLLPLLDLGSPRGSDWLERLSCYWPGYGPALLSMPHISGSLGPSAGPEQHKWRVCLDVSHFSPSEISLSVKNGFLQVGGKHEERPDEHGFVSRCFTRKYRLPAEIDFTKIVSSLSAHGLLTVEAPVTSRAVPAAIIIPIKVEEEPSEDQKEAQNSSDPEKTVPGDQEGSECHEDEQEKTAQSEEGNDACKGCEISKEML
ncbi:heat shock protein beta-1-like [Eucyclogobius newberryi]|uniref:heat shock protein beta-1-like n=1 Tax=Eucyclogobius newberryi TaxID=166745 RepID=UPI003B5A0CE8